VLHMLQNSMSAQCGGGGGMVGRLSLREGRDRSGTDRLPWPPFAPVLCRTYSKLGSSGPTPVTASNVELGRAFSLYMHIVMPAKLSCCRPRYRSRAGRHGGRRPATDCADVFTACLLPADLLSRSLVTDKYRTLPSRRRRVVVAVVAAFL